METLGGLLQIEQDVRQADSERAIEFIAANDTWRLLPYRQAVLWRAGTSLLPTARLVSGLADLAADSPLRQWLDRAIQAVAGQLLPGTPQVLSMAALPADLHAGWQEWMPPTVVAIALPTPSGDPVGGLWLAVEQAPEAAELALLERLSWVYGQSLWAWRQRLPAWRIWSARLRTRQGRKRLWLIALALALLPMRLTALAPAEIVGKGAKQIAAPVDGVVAKFLVAPNQKVVAGTPLFTLDDTTVRNRYEVAGKASGVAQADYLRATQKSFSDGASKAELGTLKAKLEEKMAEAQYTRDLLDRIRVDAPAAGVVVFSDPNDWLGKPVQTGERIVQLADPQRVEIAISLSVDDALNLDPGAPVKLYLNVAPLGALDGLLTQASYEPTLLAEGFVAYRLKADLAPGEGTPRIGLKGTAKIYGDWAPLIYHALRKPLSVVRRTLGI